MGRLAMYNILNCQQRNTTTTYSYLYLFATLNSDFYSRNLKYIIAIVGTDITEKITSFVTTAISPFSESMNKINENKSAFWPFMWSPRRCLYLHLKFAFLKQNFCDCTAFLEAGTFLSASPKSQNTCIAFCHYSGGNCFDLAPISSRICKWPIALLPCWQEKLIQNLFWALLGLSFTNMI